MQVGGRLGPLWLQLLIFHEGTEGAPHRPPLSGGQNGLGRMRICIFIVHKCVGSWVPFPAPFMHVQDQPCLLCPCSPSRSVGPGFAP